MLNRARRQAALRLIPLARRALLALCLWLIGSSAALACRSAPHLKNDFRQNSYAEHPGCDLQNQPTCRITGIKGAWYEVPTDRYGHGVLGDAIEGSRLTVYTDTTANSCGTKSVTLDAAHVFEDTAPRLADLDGDGKMEVVTVRSHQTFGAQLAIWRDGPDETLELVATTPYIGTRFRWLAPLGAADLNGDGAIEIAYVDRPHLAKTLRIWRYDAGTLTQVAAAPGFTNHRIGEVDIAGGIRDCGQGPEMILATANWSQLVSLRLNGPEISAKAIGQDTSRPAFARAMACETP